MFAPAGARRADCRASGDSLLCEGDPDNPVDATDARKTNHAFLDDIAHAGDAAPGDSGGRRRSSAAHYITGDGRGNENIGLTSVHHVFHAEHNRVRDDIDDVQATPSLRRRTRAPRPPAGATASGCSRRRAS